MTGVIEVLKKLQGLCISEALNALGDVATSAGRRPDHSLGSHSLRVGLPEACSARLDMVALALTAV